MKKKPTAGKAAKTPARKLGKKPPSDAPSTDVVLEINPPRNGAKCVVVAVGASAGGLEAFGELLKPLPKNPGMAFVLIPHLDPKHESAMTELLGRGSKMPVLQVRDGVKVSPDCVYIIPPNRSMTIHEGILQLSQRQMADRPPMPIDTFFRSLAEDCGRSAIGVILSGTASDGTLGVAAIKSEGGITFAQKPQTAKYDSMPNNAIGSGHIDFILPPSRIAKELLRIGKHPYVREPDGDGEEQVAQKPSEMTQIFRLLRQVRKVDFSEYKPGTIRRRILRRMALARIENLAEYAKILQRNRPELEALHHDILINVTSFFRDPETFDALKEIVYPEILKGRQPSETIRVWVPGCSTGEEAYSHAISLVEFVNKMRADVSIQVFGTDLAEQAIRIARAGIYKDSIAADVSPARLRRFFSKVETGYQISKPVRDMCVFANQNVFNDPPFSRMDLVSCRNVLIYMGQTLQRRVIPIFHYALNPKGFLMVGNTEGIVGPGAELFEPADKKHKIYRKKMAPSQAGFRVPHDHLEPYTPTVTSVNHTSEEPAKTPIDLQREADRLLLIKYVPAAVVVNEQLDIVQIRGRIGRYLELPSGKATLNLLKMAKSGMLFELQKMLDEAKENGLPVRRDNLQFEVDGQFGKVNVEAIPFQAPLQTLHSFIIIFEEGKQRRMEAPPQAAIPADAKDRQISQLKQELAATKEYLQSIIEALEASNEELQSANEEIQSGNEELQSTNEELQTSKEELESANEELNTVNEEMQHRNMELTQLNNDLVNLLTSVHIPIVMLDSDLSIRRITPMAEEALGIFPSDIGRPLRHVRLKMNAQDLERQMLEVIDTLQPREMAVQNSQNQPHRLRITPYRTMDNRIEGVVLVFLDSAGFNEDAGGHTPKKKSVKA